MATAAVAAKAATAMETSAAETTASEASTETTAAKAATAEAEAASTKAKAATPEAEAGPPTIVVIRIRRVCVRIPIVAIRIIVTTPVRIAAVITAIEAWEANAKAETTANETAASNKTVAAEAVASKAVNLGETRGRHSQPNQ